MFSENESQMLIFKKQGEKQMENIKNGINPEDCRRKSTAAETIIIERNGTNSPWVGCINSVNYRIERGVPVEVPAAVAAVIKSGKSVRSTAARISKAYECNAYSGGVRLNGGTCSDRVF
ncbi:MAG TPA: hypothetical protein DCY17_01985 [Clostridiales bacterium]|nr:hypothetical protein [Clostridiales bacterium]